MPLDEVSHLMLSGDAEFLALEFLDSREFLTAIANQTYSSTQCTALVEVEEPSEEVEVEEPYAEVETSALSVAVPVPVDVNANVNMDMGDGGAGGFGVGGEQKRKKRRGSGHSSSSMDKSGGRVRVHNKADRAPGGADYLKGLFEHRVGETDAGDDADEEFDASTFGPDAADLDLATPSLTSSAPAPKVTAYAAPLAPVSVQYSVPSTQMVLPSGNTQGDSTKAGLYSQSSTRDSPLVSPPTSSMQANASLPVSAIPIAASTGSSTKVNASLPVSKFPTAAATGSSMKVDASLPVSKIPTVTVTGSSTKVDASVPVSKIPTAVATVSANGFQGAGTASVPLATTQAASGPAAGSQQVSVTYRVASGGGLKDTDDSGSGVQQVTEPVAPWAQGGGRVQVGFVKPAVGVSATANGSNTESLPSRIMRVAPISGSGSVSVSASATGPRPEAVGKLAAGGGVKVPPGGPEEEIEEGVALKKAALGVRGAHARANAPHATPEANFDAPDMSGSGIVNFQNMVPTYYMELLIDIDYESFDTALS